MRARVRRMAAAAALAVAAIGLTGCGSSTDASVEIANWLDKQGARCGKAGSYEAAVVSAVPFTRVICQGVQVDFFSPDAAERYDEFWAADCAATPMDQRPAADEVIVVRGPTWVLRGDASAAGSWPESLVGSSGVTPEAAADALDGTAVSLGQVCRELGAWSA